MAISCLLNEFRPLFQTITRGSTIYARPKVLLDPFRSVFGGPGTLGVHPAVDMKEESDKYDLPGVQRRDPRWQQEHFNRGKVCPGEPRSGPVPGRKIRSAQAAETDSKAATRSSESLNQISTERMQSIHTTVQRTIWLPRPIEAQSAKAKLENGVLKVVAKKAEDKGTTVVPVE